VTGPPPPRPPASRSHAARGPLRSGVEVPRGLLAGLVGALVLCLVALAFLIGRELGRRQAAPSFALAPPVPFVSLPTPAPPPAPLPESTAPAWPTPMPSPGAGAEPAPEQGKTAAGESQAVARYFAELDAVQGQFAELQNPERLAQALLQQLSSGDSSGFDRLLDTLRQARERLVAIPTPAPCEEHQRRTLELLDVGLGLVDRVRQGVLQGDAGALLALTSDARRLETDARELEALGQKIKAQYGLPQG
jgi:hypothetical protein